MLVLDSVIRAIVSAINKSVRVARAEAKDYYSILLTLARSLSNHTISKEEFIRSVTEAFSSIGQEIYEQAAGQAYALEDEDYGLIKDWMATQTAPLLKLADDIETAGITPDINRRMMMWAASIASLGSVGYMQSHRNQVAEWRVSPLSNESCDTCSGLDRHVHSLGWYLDKGYIPGQPSSAKLLCGGWNCKCGLFNVDTGRRILPLVKMWNT